jgi:hypothetical protein
MEIKANTEFKKFIKTASQQVFIAISRIYIIGLGLLDVLPIGTTSKQNKNYHYFFLMLVRYWRGRFDQVPSALRLVQLDSTSLKLKKGKVRLKFKLIKKYLKK